MQEPRRSLSFTTAIAVAVAALIVTVVVLLQQPSGQIEAVRRMVGPESGRDLPAPRIERLGGSYRFAMTQQDSDEPVGWDPCQPVRYQVNTDGAPDGGGELIERAVERMSRATGLAFEDAGTTDDRPFSASLALRGTSPVVIGWGTPAEFPALSGDIAGIGGAAASGDTGGRRYYASGAIALDTDSFTDDRVAATPKIMEGIVLHELAHVVGLDHVTEPMELMAPTNLDQVNLGPGDSEGLARLGSLPCA